MASEAGGSERVFKTAWFSKAARKAYIADAELCSAINQVMLGQGVDLGGGVFKKRLDKNRARSIILAKGDRRWVFQYLFAKKDRENIDNDELAKFRLLAKTYEALTVQQLEQLIQDKDWVEICDGGEEQIQERRI